MRSTGSVAEAGEAKGYRSGTHRAIRPSETIARVSPHLARMGITRVANVTGLDRIGIPVVSVCRPNARSLAVSQGKGLDLEAAIASGLMEASELFHAEHVEKPLKLGSFAQLSRSHELVDTGRLAHVAGNRFHKDLKMLWVEGRDLFSGAPVWVPHESVRTDFTVPFPPGSGCFDCSSNGLASGNTFIEAVCHAICEIVERDATTLWNGLSDARRAATRLDLESVNDKNCLEIMDRFAGSEFAIDVWETTSDLGIPSFFCVAEDLRSPASHFGIGAGTHLAPHIALLRALTEAAQVRTTYISGSRDDLSADEYRHGHHVARRDIAKRLRRHHPAARDFSSIADRSTDTFTGDLALLLSRLSAAGIEQAVAVDLTRPEIGLPVVRVVLPGLEGPDDHEAYVPGERARRQAGALA